MPNRRILPQLMTRMNGKAYFNCTLNEQVLVTGFPAFRTNGGIVSRNDESAYLLLKQAEDSVDR